MMEISFQGLCAIFNAMDIKLKRLLLALVVSIVVLSIMKYKST